MIQVIVKKNGKEITGFHIEGHSGYADSGRDIVCAAVSALAINCINSIDTFTDDVYHVGSEEESGMIDFNIQGEVSDEAGLLLKSLLLGLSEISKTYGKQYLTVRNR